MAGSGRWADAHLVGLLLVGRQVVPAVALRAARLLSGRPAVLSALRAVHAVYAVHAGGPRPVRLPRLDAAAGRAPLPPVASQLITLRPWCFSYHRRSSGSQRARAMRPTA